MSDFTGRSDLTECSDFTGCSRYYPLTYTAVFPDGERIYFARNPFKPLTQAKSLEMRKEHGGNIRDYLISVIGKKLGEIIGEESYEGRLLTVSVFERFGSAFDWNNTMLTEYQLVYEYTEEGWKHTDTQYGVQK